MSSNLQVFKHIFSQGLSNFKMFPDIEAVKLYQEGTFSEIDHQENLYKNLEISDILADLGLCSLSIGWLQIQ